MDYRKSRYLYLLLALVFLFVSLSSFSLFNRWYGQNQQSEATVKTVEVKPVIQESTILQKEVRYQCGDRMLSDIPISKDLLGLDYAGLLEFYPEEEGWEIDDSIPNFLTISQEINEICPVHQQYFHFGQFDGKLAVYQGPLGINEESYLKETLGVLVQELPKEYQEQLKLAETYQDQSLVVRKQLESSLQFSSADELEIAISKLLEELES